MAAQPANVRISLAYVDLLRDEDGFVWIGVHFGSRGLGNTSATRYLKAAGGKSGINVTSQRWSSRDVMPTRAASGWWSGCAESSAAP